MGMKQKKKKIAKKISKLPTQKNWDFLVGKKTEFVSSFFGRIIGLKETLRLCMTFNFHPKLFTNFDPDRRGLEQKISHEVAPLPSAWL